MNETDDQTTPIEPIAHEPVAYDTNGQPLYAHPPVDTANQKPQVVYMARPLEPQQPHVSAGVQKKAAASKAAFPHLNLSTGEYVISAIRRHPIGLFSIWFVVTIFVITLFAAIPFIMSGEIGAQGLEEGGEMLAFIFLMLAALVFMGGVIATVVYNANRFYLTNESVIQHIQTSLFSKKEQTISLTNIEDASFRQHGIMQQLLDYGSLRLSTEGEETTYRFNYVSHPQQQISILNNAVEAFKNGRPVDPSDDN